MEWFEELGMEDNPFETNPLRTNFKLVDREKEAKEVIYRIASGNMLVIEGKEGVGKTALLKHAIENFRGKGKVIYVDAKKLSKRLNIANLLKKRPKAMILLIDNVTSISKKNNERIKYFYDRDHIKSVIFTTADYSLVNFSEAIKDRVSNNIIKLQNLIQKDALDAAKARFDNDKLLPEKALKQLYKESGSLKDFLKRCALLCSYLVENKKQEPKQEDVNKIIKKKVNVIVDDETELCSECDSKLVNINDYWRCENCDQYCVGCGALAADEDGFCPECGARFEEDEE